MSRKTILSITILVLMTLCQFIHAAEEHHDEHAEGEEDHVTEAWVSALGAVAIATVISVVGILSIPVNK